MMADAGLLSAEVTELAPFMEGLADLHTGRIGSDVVA